MNKIKMRVEKKAWKAIKAIQLSTNMVEVNTHISDAIIDTFDLRNLGLSKIAAKKSGTLLDWEKRKERNHNLMIEQTENIRTYLLTFVPLNIRKCAMYNL